MSARIFRELARRLALLAALGAAMVPAAAPAVDLPAGFEAPAGATVRAVRIDEDVPLPSFAAQRQQIEQTCRRLVEARSPAAGTPLFEAGWDAPGRSQLARFITPDGGAEVSLHTIEGYGCKARESMCRCTYAPTRDRFQRLTKTVDGRQHRWEARLDLGTGSHTIAARGGRLAPDRRDGVVLEDGLGPPLGQEEHLGLRCEVRAGAGFKVCRFVPQTGLPQVLVGRSAWIRGERAGAQDYRISRIGTDADLPVRYLEPPAGIRYVEHDLRPARGSSPDPAADTEGRKP